MLQLRAMFLAVGTCALSGIVGLANVKAQTSQPQSPVSQTQPAPATQDNQPVARVQIATNTTVKRGDRIVCKQEAILGTRLKGIRTCRTADEWRRISRGFQARLKETNDKGGAAFSGN